MTADIEEDGHTKIGEEPHSTYVGFSGQSGLVHRSNRAAVVRGDDEEHSSPVVGHDNFHDSGENVAANIQRRRQSFLDDDELDPIDLPESTHTLLFTEPIFSVPFAVGISIAGLSILCLLLALFDNNLGNIKDVIPANVDVAVKTAQYTSIFIALLMEEEIPTGLYLLKRIPRQYFKSKFPELSYRQFVFANVLRIAMGYLFLFNVLITVIKASDVLEIFFDFIALQFIQQLDDIAFNLAKMSMLSTTLKEATSRRYFRTEFKRTKMGRHGWTSWFFTIIYIINLCGLLSGMIYVSVKQASGDYQCKSITANFNEDVWRHAIVELSNREYEDRPLVYSFFSGVYVQDGTRHDGRPVYIERSKFDGSEFDTSPLSGVTNSTANVKIPAKIQYCKSIKAWVFMHENIRKSKRDHDSDCPWLLRSETTDAYDIEDVQGPWQVWQGVIGTSNVQISCNECSDDDDCNLNGMCNNIGRCECYDDVEGMTFLGPHCEVILEDECRTIIGALYNETHSVIETGLGNGQLWETYHRPMYMYNVGSGLPQELIDGSYRLLIVYSGSRWFGNYYKLPVFSLKDATFYLRNYHAFWDKVYTFNTVHVSDPITATDYTPVGVDFFMIGKRGDQFGPFGERIPFNSIQGSGHFRCAGKTPLNLTNTSTSNSTVGERVLEQSREMFKFDILHPH